MVIVPSLAPLQLTSVEATDAFNASGSTTSNVPVAAAQLLSSVMLYARPVPAA